MKNSVWKLALRAVAFLLIFLTLFTIVNMIWLPKRHYTEETAQPVGFYHEPKNSVDVLYLGSCNMYSSVSPVLIYEKTGITGYAFCCPDQEMSTSYTYLKEAMERQDLKAVVVEALFITQVNGKNREHYNRFAMDYFPLNFNKIRLALEMSKREAALMKQYDSSAPDALLTFAGYLFPVLRYHGRTDLGKEDLTFFLENDLYNPLKGGVPQYTYTSNDDNFFDKIFNGKEVNEMSRKYLPMMKELCDEKGIPLIIAKSPNYARWGYDDTQTKIVRDFAEELGVPFIDFHSPEYGGFQIYDYGYQTGRLNIYGVRRFSGIMADYLTQELGLKPTQLSEENRQAWDSCVEQYYQVAKEKNCNLYPGELAELRNLDGAMRVRWNPCDDCDSYSIYRCVGKDGSFALIADSAAGEYFDDGDVTSGQGYTYYVVPNTGARAGQASPTMYYIYLDMPQNLTAENRNGTVHLDWEPVEAAGYYRIQRRYGSDFNFSQYETTKYDSYTNKKVSDGNLYYYRIVAACKEDGNTYYSMSTITWMIPQTTPVIKQVSMNGQITITWKELTKQKKVQIWRMAEGEESYQLIDTVSGTATKYTDKSAKKGVEYYYRIVTLTSVFSRSVTSDFSNTVSAKIPK